VWFDMGLDSAMTKLDSQFHEPLFGLYNKYVCHIIVDRGSVLFILETLL